MAVFLGILAGPSAVAQPVLPNPQSASDTQDLFNLNPSARSEQHDTAFSSSDGYGVPASPGDDDLGQQQILKKEERYRAWSAWANFNAFYTSNAALTEQNTLGDAMLVGSVGAGYQPIITGDLIANVYVQQQAYRYGTYSALDFDSLNTGAALTYIIRDFYDVAVSGGYNFNRLTPRGGYESSFYDNNTINFTLQKTHAFDRAQNVNGGLLTNINFTSPYSTQRNEYGLYASYTAQITRGLQANLYYRLSLQDYSTDGRNDLNQAVVPSFTYNFTPWCSVTASTSFGFNSSNRDGFDYDVINAGGGVNFNYRF